MSIFSNYMGLILSIDFINISYVLLILPVDRFFLRGCPYSPVIDTPSHVISEQTKTTKTIKRHLFYSIFQTLINFIGHHEHVISLLQLMIARYTIVVNERSLKMHSE